MPWKPSEAKSHNHKASTPEMQRVWAKVANAVLKKTGDEGKAIREANAAISRIKK